MTPSDDDEPLLPVQDAAPIEPVSMKRSLVLLAVVAALLLLLLLCYPSTSSEPPSLEPISRLVTVCTAFYPSTAAKHSLDEYAEWNARFLSMVTPMVVATTSSHYPHLAVFRYSRLFVNATAAAFTPDTINRLDRVALPLLPGASLVDLPTYWLVQWSNPQDIVWSPSVYQLQHMMDPEAHRHSPHLYAVWTAKTFLLNLTATLNPFRSLYFFWMDMGQFRGGDDTYTQWPDKQRVLELFRGGDSQLLYVDISPWSKDWCNGSASPNAVDRVEGTNFGGSAAAIHQHTSRYYSLVSQYMEHGLFFGKDQIIMNAAALQWPDDYWHLHAHKGCGNIWFFFAQFLARKNDRWRECPTQVYDIEKMVARRWQDLCGGNKLDR